MHTDGPLGSRRWATFLASASSGGDKSRGTNESVEFLWYGWYYRGSNVVDGVMFQLSFI
jgi:hypothetical protein